MSSTQAPETTQPPKHVVIPRTGQNSQAEINTSSASGYPEPEGIVYAIIGHVMAYIGTTFANSLSMLRPRTILPHGDQDGGCTHISMARHVQFSCWRGDSSHPTSRAITTKASNSSLNGKQRLFIAIPLSAEATIAVTCSGASWTHKGCHFLKGHCPSTSVASLLIQFLHLPAKGRTMNSNELDVMLGNVRALSLPKVMGPLPISAGNHQPYCQPYVPSHQ
eukprot:3015799-Amphidinium_carterae.1